MPTLIEACSQIAMDGTILGARTRLRAGESVSVDNFTSILGDLIVEIDPGLVP